MFPVRHIAFALLFAALASAKGGKVYEVGPGYSKKTLAAVPWDNLSAGDVVNIHAAASGCYAEKILISTPGRSWDQPITVQGVLDANGKRPCITGRHAKQVGSASDALGEPSESLYVVGIGPQADMPGSWPQYILLKNLEITGASAGEPYISDKKTHQYGGGVAGIRMLSARHVRIENCWVHDIGGNGIFGKPHPSTGPLTDVQIWYNRLGGNGRPGDAGVHNLYVESDGAVYGGNRFDPLTPGAMGAHLKDRSAGTVIAHNYFSGAARRYIDLVDADDGWEIFGSRPYYGCDFVFGNVLRLAVGEEPADLANTLIHYGGDSGHDERYRRQTLNFYHNTVVIVADRSDRPQVALFQPEVQDGELDLRNNVFAVFPRTPQAAAAELVLLAGRDATVPAIPIQFGVNWLTEGWAMCLPRGSSCYSGDVAGADQLVTGKDPKFAGPGKFTPAAGSPLIGAGGPLSPLVATNPQNADYTPKFEYVFDQQIRPRSLLGEKSDLGAFAGAAEPPAH